MNSSASAPVLSLRGVTKKFGKFTAVKEIHLDIRKGEIFGFLGPNGAGKTTTIKLVLDIIRPTEGSIELFGMSNRLTTQTHRRLGYLSGDMVLDDDLTGRQYLDFVGHTYDVPYAAKLQELATQLQANLAVKIGNYSRGNKQKIGLIAALMHAPELLILDEPSSGFDPLVQETFMELIEQYRQSGGTVFISSHTLSEVQRLCDRVGFIRDGELVAVTTIDDLNQSASKHVRATADTHTIDTLKTQAIKLAGLKLLESHSTRLGFSYQGDIQALLRFFAGYKLDDVSIREPELDEIFMRYYEEAKPA